MKLISGYLDRMERETVVAHLAASSSVPGASIRGVLMAVHRDCIVLAHASYLLESGPKNIDGEAVIPREKVDWIQRLPAEVAS